MPDRWWESARCAGTDTELFFPEARQDATPALSLCAGCPVLLACRAHALTQPERYGIWGGLTENERLELRRAASATRLALIEGGRANEGEAA